MAQDTGHETLVLHQMLDLRSAPELQRRLVAALLTQGTLTIDASAVARMSTAALQLIIAFLAAARAKGIKVVISGVTASFASAFEAMGLDHLLEAAGQETVA